MQLDALLARSSARRRLPTPELRRLIRERAHVTQDELAQTVGVSRPAVTRWETGTRTPDGEHLERYLEVLDRLIGAA